MHIVFLNGTPGASVGGGSGAGDSGGPELEGYLAGLEDTLRQRGHEIERFDLREMKIPPCVGCWGCWVKTPGQCAHKGDDDNVCRAYINADLVVLASPLVMGFVSSELKLLADKLIPLAHPYVRFTDGECMHVLRYPDHVPALASVLAPTADDDAEDLAISRDWVARTAQQFHSPVAFAATLETPYQEVTDALDRL